MCKFFCFFFHCFGVYFVCSVRIPTKEDFQKASSVGWKRKREYLDDDDSSRDFTRRKPENPFTALREQRERELQEIASLASKRPLLEVKIINFLFSLSIIFLSFIVFRMNLGIIFYHS